MILTGEAEVLKHLPQCHKSTVNLTRTGRVSKLGLRGERPVNNRLGHGRLKTDNLIYKRNFSSYRTENSL